MFLMRFNLDNTLIFIYIVFLKTFCLFSSKIVIVFTMEQVIIQFAHFLEMQIL